MMSAVEKLAKSRTVLDKERADSFGGVELVAGYGQQIELQALEVDGNFSGGLDGIGVEVDVGFGGNVADFGEGLNHAELIVGLHHGDENGLGAKSMAKIAEIDETITIDGKIRDGDTLCFECLASIEDGFMLDGGGDYMA